MRKKTRKDDERNGRAPKKEIEITSLEGEGASKEVDAAIVGNNSNLLTEAEKYLKSGVHIGTKFKSDEMKRYIRKKRSDGLMMFDIETIDSRIRMIGKLLSKYKGEEVVIVSRRLYGHKAAKKFAAMTGAKTFISRFIPGTFTNANSRRFFEPKIVMVCDPMSDFQAVKEAATVRVPVIAIAGSESVLKNVDLIIPANNKGRKSLALIFYLLTREVLAERGEISRENFKEKIEDFEQEVEEKKLEEAKKRFTTRRFGNRSGGNSGGRRSFNRR
jgi:small subunit ribosomal protein S2